MDQLRDPAHAAQNVVQHLSPTSGPVLLWFDLHVPAGTPINLFANLNSSAALHAALAHIRYRDNPRALAKALLNLSDCPDLVEDSGHLYGTDLTTAQKNDLIAFLKTL